MQVIARERSQSQGPVLVKKSPRVGRTGEYGEEIAEGVKDCTLRRLRGGSDCMLGGGEECDQGQCMYGSTTSV